MSSVIKLSQQLSLLSRQLVQAQELNDAVEIERIEDDMAVISDQLDDLTSFEESHDYR